MGSDPDVGGPASIIAVLNCELSCWKYHCGTATILQADVRYGSDRAPMRTLLPQFDNTVIPKIQQKRSSRSKIVDCSVLIGDLSCGKSTQALGRNLTITRARGVSFQE